MRFFVNFGPLEAPLNDLGKIWKKLGFVFSPNGTPNRVEHLEFQKIENKKHPTVQYLALLS